MGDGGGRGEGGGRWRRSKVLEVVRGGGGIGGHVIRPPLYNKQLD